MSAVLSQVSSSGPQGVRPEAPARGLYVALEGVDGCGKSTQAALLAEHLGALLTQEPGGSALGADIKQMLLAGRTDLSPLAEVLLFAADRAEHLGQLVEPALASGRDVVSSRSVWSSVVYQGFGRGLPIDEIIAVNRFATAGVFPDVVVYLRSDLARATSRVQARSGGQDRIEAAGPEFFARCADGFEQLAARFGWVVVDPGSVQQVAQRIADEVSSRRAVLAGGDSR